MLGLSIFTFGIQATNKIVKYVKISSFHFGYHGVDRKREGVSLITNFIQTTGSSAPMTIIWDFLHTSLHLLVNSNLLADFPPTPTDANSEKWEQLPRNVSVGM